MSDGAEPLNAKPESERAPLSPWSFPILEISGISIRIHVTFVLFLVWIGMAQEKSTALWIGFIIAVFFCVLLHELGHALTALRFGISTRSITLYPIGGVALLEGRPQPREELWIALAGPAVNLVIAALLAPFALLQHGGLVMSNELTTPGAFVSALMTANLTLALFNLIPAFPMDGGRVLRAALGLSMPERRATRIAAGVGQGMAFLIAFAALFIPNPWLFVIAAFVFFGAGQEYSATVARSFLEGHTVTDAMQVRFQTIASGASLEEAAKLLLEGSQHDFPVVVGDEVVGVLSRSNIARGLATDGPTGFVAGHMSRQFKRTEPGFPLDKGIELFMNADGNPILVMDDDRLVGILTQENLSEFIMLAHARAQKGG